MSRLQQDVQVNESAKSRSDMISIYLASMKQQQLASYKAKCPNCGSAKGLILLLFLLSLLLLLLSLSPPGHSVSRQWGLGAGLGASLFVASHGQGVSWGWGQVMWGEGGRGLGMYHFVASYCQGVLTTGAGGWRGGVDLGLHLFVASHCQGVLTTGAGGWRWGWLGASPLCSLPLPRCFDHRGWGMGWRGASPLCSLPLPGCFDHRGWGMEGGVDLGLHLFVASHCQGVLTTGAGGWRGGWLGASPLCSLPLPARSAGCSAAACHWWCQRTGWCSGQGWWGPCSRMGTGVPPSPRQSVYTWNTSFVSNCFSTLSICLDWDSSSRKELWIHVYIPLCCRQGSYTTHW